MATVHERMTQERMAESYRAGFAAGAASRDAEVARLRGALADAIGILEALNRVPDSDYARPHPDDIAELHKALNPQEPPHAAD